MIKPTIQSVDQRGKNYCMVLRSAHLLQHRSTDQTYVNFCLLSKIFMGILLNCHVIILFS